MAEKNIKSRIIHKNDTNENWQKAVNFIPKLGEIVIYNSEKSWFKIGDGKTNINDLPFAKQPELDIIDAGSIADYMDTIIAEIIDAGSISSFI